MDDIRLDQCPEQRRLVQSSLRQANWKRWGPYLSERQWGTVREDYSKDGESWNYFPHDHARARAYRWGEDGLLGITDRQCRLCFAVALWNGKDPILKERLFGLTGPEGNHGEDVKECYYYLESTPTHSYMRGLYKYPQTEYPYKLLVDENQRRTRDDPEFELLDAGVFDEDRYWDVEVSYAKAKPDDILICINIVNRGPELATIHLLPTLWFRNTWSWGKIYDAVERKPSISQDSAHEVLADHETLGEFRLSLDPKDFGSEPAWLFTENVTNEQLLYGRDQQTNCCKDAFHEFVVHSRADSLCSVQVGTKTAAHSIVELGPQQSQTLQLRLFHAAERPQTLFGSAFQEVFEQRKAESDGFYNRVSPQLAPELRNISGQAIAGLLWSKQFYYYSVPEWLAGDQGHPKPPASRMLGRNRGWYHLFNRDVISMPDKWEYPWYAAWDLAFHMIPLARIDEDFAKEQLLLFLREWYMHPNGQIPAYEFALSDVNPPVHAWACWRVYKMTGKRGSRDRRFLARAFHKLLLNFTWWVNRKDENGDNLFSGGFLGLDNVGVFDRSRPLPTGGRLEQADGTAWVAFFCGTMLSIALELASADPEYEDIASKFFEHFVAIADAMNSLGGTGLWDEQDGFYYDQIHIAGNATPLKSRSMVGLVPLFAVEVLEEENIQRLPGFRKRMEWFLRNRPDLAKLVTFGELDSGDQNQPRHRMLAIPSRDRLRRVLQYVFSEEEFLSDFGIRSLSKIHQKRPYRFEVKEQEYRVDYVPGESNSPMFGGNSNWRGPVWFPMNLLLIESLERYYHYYGDSFLMEFPTGSGSELNLQQIAARISERLIGIFLPDETGQRPCHGGQPAYLNEAWADLVLYYEYFHAESGKGLGASHQTGWTSVVSHLINSSRSNWEQTPASENSA